MLDEALASVGDTYDLRNIFDLARYFFPVSLVPRALSPRGVAFRSGRADPGHLFEHDRGMLPAGAFSDPADLRAVAAEGQRPAPPARLWQMLRRSDRRAADGVFSIVSPSLITPRDFDLSPYFEIVKFNIIESMRFDYRKMLWADDTPARAHPRRSKKGA